MNERLIVQEGQLLAVFNSAHRVMAAEDLLKRLNLDILLIPAPRKLQTDCGLALRFTDAERQRIMAALEEKNLLPAFICRLEGGEYITAWGERT